MTEREKGIEALTDQQIADTLDDVRRLMEAAYERRDEREYTRLASQWQELAVEMQIRKYARGESE